MDVKPAAILDNVSHRYGERTALAGVSVTIPAGQRVGLIGPDGVGKSTFLALLAGVRKLQQGSLQVLDHNMQSAGARRRICSRIAYMPQGLGKNLYMTLSVYENIDFFARLFGLNAKDRAQRIDMLLKSTGLSPFRDRPAGKLSGGMKQKLGLCCALIHDPDLLILDEPTTGVDPLSRRQFWELIERIRRQRPAMSVVIATAYMEEAAQLDWLLAMDDGRILASGTPADLMQQTQTRDLDAAFIALLPEQKRQGHVEIHVPPRTRGDGEVAIEAISLSKRFGNFTAVDGVNFTIERGEIFGFVGSNGCGKTTTMKMLTGLLSPSEGQAKLFGRETDPHDMATRTRVGFMSQAFSLYEELTVLQNLTLHAKLFHFPAERREARIQRMLSDFDLQQYRDALAKSLPLGIRQRLSLAVATIHEPEMLILDEPTSGVDPVARDGFWQQLIRLSREEGVTIFVSTHFMNEAQRCDRISLMHAGKVLATGTPEELRQSRNKVTLEESFIDFLQQEQGEAVHNGESLQLVDEPDPHETSRIKPFSLGRLLAYSRRETTELLRDPIRLTFAFLGTVILMFVLGYGINMDVEDIAFAVLDRDQSPESRDYIDSIAGSRYFEQKPPLHSDEEMDQRMRSGELSMVIEIPPDYGRDLRRGQIPSISVWVDGAMPFRAETISGYVQGFHADYLADLLLRYRGDSSLSAAASIQARYRYNPDFKSLPAMVPAVLPLLLLMIPAMLTALSVVREKELGSITNFYATPVRRIEFLLGKQLPYIVISMINFFCLVWMALLFFDVPVKGGLLALSLGALLYVLVSTGMGLFMSSFTRTQIAAIFATMVATLMPAINYAGLINPVSSLEGMGYLVGKIYPATYFLLISRGAFTKGLFFDDLAEFYPPLIAAVVVFTLLNVLLLRKQER